MSNICYSSYTNLKSNEYVKTTFISCQTGRNGNICYTIDCQKWTNFQELSAVFPDPLGVGSPLSLGLAIFGELACSMAFIIGFLYRLAMIPMVFTMAVAFFVIHGNDPFATKELAFVYLVVFILMYIIGPGKFAVDRWIRKALFQKARK